MIEAKGKVLDCCQRLAAKASSAGVAAGTVGKISAIETSAKEQ